MITGTAACKNIGPRRLLAGVRLELPYQPPMDWASLLGFYRLHRLEGVEAVSDSTYERVFRIGGAVRVLKVSHPYNEPGKVIVEVSGGEIASLSAIIQKVRWMFDLDLDPCVIEKCFRAHKAYRGLWKTYPGLRVGRAWDAFETGISTILGQNVSLAAARMLVKQLIDSYGERVTHPLTGESGFLFPQPETLACAGLEQVKTTSKRREAIRALATAVAEGQVNLENGIDPQVLRKSLAAIPGLGPGLGPWSAEYIALRGVGECDAFPHTDLLLQRAIKNQPELCVEQLRPWRSYAAIYLWKKFSKAF